MDLGERIKQRVDAAIEANQEDGRRTHLGPSALGKQCDRAIWYSFRWYTNRRHDAKLLRIFERGQNEESVIIRRLRLAGITVHDADVDGKQFGFSTFEGHFKGSVDGIIEVPGVEKTGLLEIKTINKNGYNKLLREGVTNAHRNQMQAYMHYLELSWGLHITACKDNDEWHFSIVPYDEVQALNVETRASHILRSKTPPARMLYASPTYKYCREYCDHYEVCHKDAEPERNCRSCAHVVLAKDGNWGCTAYEENKIINDPLQGMPCKGKLWKEITQ